MSVLKIKNGNTWESISVIKGDKGEVSLADLNTALRDKADVITDTASGAIASFSDGADNLPLKSLVVDINPIQDLHGQDAPYPAGGGKNKFPFPTITSPTTYAGVTLTVNDDMSMHIQGTATSRANFGLVARNGWSLLAGTWTISGEGLNANVKLIYGDTDASVPYGELTGTPKTFEATGGVGGYLILRVDSGTTVNQDVKIQIESGSTATAWSPYENICPISGWTEVGVEQRGANVWDEEWEIGALVITTGLNTADIGCFRSKNYIQLIPNATYFVHGTAIRFCFYDADKNFVESPSSFTNTTFTVPSNVAYGRFYKRVSPTVYNHDISINYPSTDHDYHPYTGRSITIDLGQTVYGGHIDVLSGELTVYPYYASYNGETLTGEWISDRDKYVSGTAPTIGAQVVNIGAQGVTVQLEPHEAESLYGVNNIWADSGDTEVVYRADTKLYISKKIAEAISALS